jgi:hypothetical protein
MPVVGAPPGSVVARKNSILLSVPPAPDVPGRARKSSLSTVIWLCTMALLRLPVPDVFWITCTTTGMRSTVVGAQVADGLVWFQSQSG